MRAQRTPTTPSTPGGSNSGRSKLHLKRSKSPHSPTVLTPTTTTTTTTSSSLTCSPSQSLLFKESSSRRQKSPHNHDYPEDLSDMSTASSDHQQQHFDEQHDDSALEEKKTWQEQLIESIDDLTEKRGKGAKRTTALNTINTYMTKYHSMDALSRHVDTACRNIFGCLVKSASDEETLESLKALNLLGVTFGGASSDTGIDSDMSDKTMETCLEMALRESLSSKIRCRALFTYALWNFIDRSAEDFITLGGGGAVASSSSSSSSSSAQQKKTPTTPSTATVHTPALEVLQSFWPKVPDADYKADQDLLAQSISCWSWLCTIVPDHLMDKYVVPHAKNTLMKLVLNDHSSFQVKKAAAEAMCLLVENTSFSSEATTLFDDACEEIRRLSTQVDRSTTKKDKSAQKAQFRDFLATIEDGEAPEMNLTISGVSLNFESWSRIIQFNNFKSVLKSGINTHFADNEFVREVFDVSRVDFSSSDSKSMMTSGEKKFYLGKGSVAHKEDTKQKNKLTRKFAQYLSVEE